MICGKRLRHLLHHALSWRVHWSGTATREYWCGKCNAWVQPAKEQAGE